MTTDTLVIIFGAVVGAALVRAPARRVIRATARVLEPRLLQGAHDADDDIQHHEAP